MDEVKEYPTNKGLLDMSYCKRYKPARFKNDNLYAKSVTFDYVCPDEKEQGRIVVKTKTINMSELIESAYDLQAESAEYYKGVAEYENDSTDIVDRLRSALSKEDYDNVLKALEKTDDSQTGEKDTSPTNKVEEPSTNGGEK